MHWGYSGWGMGFGSIFMILLWGLIILGVIYLIKNVAQNPKKEKKEQPLDSLKKRYARGEITKDEFEKIKKDLKGY